MSVTFFALINDQQDVDLERLEINVSSNAAREIEDAIAFANATEAGDIVAGELPADAFLADLLIAQNLNNSPELQRNLNRLWDLAHEAREMARRGHKDASIAWG